MDENIVTQPEVIEPQQEVTPDVPVQEAPKESQSFKVKHLHEEKEISFDEAPTYIQKGLDYDRVRQKFEENKPVIGFVEKLAQQNNMTVPEYLKAVDEYQRQQEIEELSQQRNLDPELAQELYLLRNERKERTTQQQQQQEQQRQQQEYLDFFNEFPDVKPESIPDEVWKIKAEKGLSVTDAYIRYEHNQLKNNVKVAEVNNKNASASTGSVTGNGASFNDVLTAEKIESMSEKEIASRWSEVKKVLGMR